MILHKPVISKLHNALFWMVVIPKKDSIGGHDGDVGTKHGWDIVGWVIV